MRHLYAGNTTLNEGTLVLNKSVGPNILGPTFTIGDNVGGPNADVVRYGSAAAGDQIAEYTSAGINVVAALVNSSGLLDLNGKSDSGDEQRHADHECQPRLQP